MQTTPWIISKFGGNSVADLHCWQTIADITRQHLSQGYRPLIVCSALTGITNKLTQLCIAHADRKHILQSIIEDYQALVEKLNLTPYGDVGRIKRSESALTSADSLRLIRPTLNIAEDFQALHNLVNSLPLTQEAPPAIKAKILSFGEIILTKIGTAFLQAQGISIAWCDARLLLKSTEGKNTHAQSQYLAAKCDYTPDKNLMQKLDQMPAAALITQGFIASNAQDETVLLGRGGSDTSAAYFAAKLAAKRCEIWTDVPGIYSANPREIPDARLLKSLDYDEAQEIASMGGKVLHPYSILPAKANNIPLYIGCTRTHKRPGTGAIVKCCVREFRRRAQIVLAVLFHHA